MATTRRPMSAATAPQWDQASCSAVASRPRPRPLHRLRRHVDLDVEAADLGDHVGRRAARDELGIARRGAPLGVDQPGLQLQPGHRRVLRQLVALDQVVQPVRLGAQRTLEAHEVAVLEGAALDRLAHGPDSTGVAAARPCPGSRPVRAGKLGMGLGRALWSDAARRRNTGSSHATSPSTSPGPASSCARPCCRRAPPRSAAPATRDTRGRGAVGRQGPGGSGRLGAGVLCHQRGAAVAAGPDQLLAVRAAVGQGRGGRPDAHLRLVRRLFRRPAAAGLDGAGPGLLGVCRDQPELLGARGHPEGGRRAADAVDRLAGAGQDHARCAGVDGRRTAPSSRCSAAKASRPARRASRSAWPSSRPTAA